jgi:hypothetical protein
LKLKNGDQTAADAKSAAVWRLANACTVWGDLFNRPVCVFVRSGNGRE